MSHSGVFVSQVQGSVLIAELTCYEDDVIQVGHLVGHLSNTTSRYQRVLTDDVVFVSSESVQAPGGDPERERQQTELPEGDGSTVQRQ